MDGKPVAVVRLPDGLKVRLPADRPRILSAHADRGLVDYQGDVFVITLAAYAQDRPASRAEDLELGVDNDQLRLLLVAGADGSPVVRASWHGQPAADLVVQVFRGEADHTDFRTDARGEIPCPDLRSSGASLLAQVVDPTPGTRDGKAYSHIRHKATLQIAQASATAVPK